jgi:hypothetical protein
MALAIFSRLAGLGDVKNDRMLLFVVLLSYV